MELQGLFALALARVQLRLDPLDLALLMQEVLALRGDAEAVITQAALPALGHDLLLDVDSHGRLIRRGQGRGQMVDERLSHRGHVECPEQSALDQAV